VRRDVPEILQAVDVFGLTSVSEAASLTLLEAMAAGRPVVVTDVGGNPEIVRQGIDGFLVPRGDDAATAAAILYLLDRPHEAAAMGEAGRRRVQERYQLQRTIERYYGLYSNRPRLAAVAGSKLWDSRNGILDSGLGTASARRLVDVAPTTSIP
jgi:L-malate glycosyltransferase